MSIEKIDMNKYDRVLRTYGLESMHLIAQSNIYIIGLHGGYAGEICKNLALSGIKTITLIGTETIESNDKQSSIYYRNEKIGEKCSTLLAKSIVELNSMVEVKCFDTLDELIKNSVVVTINNIDAIEINNLCRLYKCKLVALFSNHFTGSIFVDCIEQTVYNTDGENKASVNIKDMTNTGIIYCDHNFNVGDIVKISCLQDNWKITDTNKRSITIRDKKNLFTLPTDFKFINGIVEYIPQPTTFIHKPLSEHNLDNIKSSDIISPQPVISFLGSVASNEVIKLITVKYTPLNQWFTWSDKIDLPILNKLNILMIGCGALGCEWLKNLAMMDCIDSLDIVDMDHIEHSNLSRQFLFRSHHVKQSKCKVAKEAILKINPLMNITCYENKISNQDSEFTEKVFKNKDIVISCLDNIEARRYVDLQCFNRCIPLFESGTMGMKGNTMPIIPYVTETYSNTSDPEEESQYPVCTIKNFPNNSIHTIHWARDNFEQYNRGPMNCNKYIENPCFLDNLSLLERNQAIDDINYFLVNPPEKIEDCIIRAIKSFEYNFNHSIQQLLHCFPPNHMLDNKTLFWSHGKICPKPLYYSKEAVEYVEATTQILCSVYSIPFYKIEIDEFIIDEYKPADIKIAKDDSELSKTVTNESILSKNIINIKLNPQEFEKDDDNNGHIDYITSASNCRCCNYGINITTKYETKGIAGRIIPAVAATTSAIVGLIGIELLRYISGCTKINEYRSWFLNMADNTMVYSEPMEMPKIKIGSKYINGWTKYNYTKDTTLKEFVDYYSKELETVYMVLYESRIVYSEFSDDNDTKLSVIFNSYNIDITKTEVILTLVSEDSSIEFPPIKLFGLTL
jgi:molybdopterin/thiamine biosynthesis adenylyltransferase